MATGPRILGTRAKPTKARTVEAIDRDLAEAHEQHLVWDAAVGEAVDQVIAWREQTDLLVDERAEAMGLG